MLHLPQDAAAVQAGAHARCALPALPGASGLVLLGSAGGSRLRPVVLAADAAVADEISALGAAADAGAAGCCTPAEVEAAALAIGGALAPGAPPQLLYLALAVAARHALHATLTTLLQHLDASGGLNLPRTLDDASRMRLRAAAAAADAAMACLQRERGIFAPPHALEVAAELLAHAPPQVRVDAMALLALVLNEVRVTSLGL